MKGLLHLSTLCSLLILTASNIANAEDADPSVLTPLSDTQRKEQEVGEALARKIMARTPRFSIIGSLEQDASGVFFINGERIKITSATRVEGELMTGAVVAAHGFVENGERTARVVQVTTTAPHATAALTTDLSEGPRLDMNEQKNDTKKR